MTASIHYTPVVNNLQLLKGFSLRFVNMNETIMSVYKNKHHPTLDQARLTRRLVYPVGGVRVDSTKTIQLQGIERRLALD